MANTKKTVVEDEVEVVEEVKPVKKVNKAKHDSNELIECRSVVFGKLILIGPKTNMRYIWANQGDVREVEYQDLVSWKALGSKYLFDPKIIIEDETICEEWKSELGQLYEEVKAVDLKALFNLPQRQFVTKLKQLPPSMKSSVQNMAYAMIRDKTLDSLSKIEAIDEILGTELKTMI